MGRSIFKSACFIYVNTKRIWIKFGRGGGASLTVDVINLFPKHLR